MKIPMVDLPARHKQLGTEVEEQILDLLRSGRWIGGEVLASCEQEVAQSFGRKYGVGVASGTDALIIALQALGIGPGDEVIVPALTFYATAGAVLRVGARPVVADVLADVPLIDPSSVKDLVGPKTKAILLVHLFGMKSPVPELGIPIIEDSAQAAGQDPAAAAGCLTTISFYPTKTLSCAGDGGMIATDDPELARLARSLGNHGGVKGQAHLHELVKGVSGYNSRLDPIQAVILRAQLKTLGERIKRRQWIQSEYEKAVPRGVIAVRRDPGDPIHHTCFCSEQRAQVLKSLSAANVDNAVYYPRPLSEQPALGEQPPTPRAEKWCQEIFSLPCHATLTDEQVEYTCKALAESLR